MLTLLKKKLFMTEIFHLYLIKSILETVTINMGIGN